MMQIDDLATDRETEAGAAALGSTPRTLVKLVEYLVEFIPGDTDSLVGHPHPTNILLTLELNSYLASGTGGRHVNRTESAALEKGNRKGWQADFFKTKTEFLHGVATNVSATPPPSAAMTLEKLADLELRTCDISLSAVRYRV